MPGAYSRQQNDLIKVGLQIGPPQDYHHCNFATRTLSYDHYRDLEYTLELLYWSTVYPIVYPIVFPIVYYMDALYHKNTLFYMKTITMNREEYRLIAF